VGHIKTHFSACSEEFEHFLKIFCWTLSIAGIAYFLNYPEYFA
jgi:hypothetical protein